MEYAAKTIRRTHIDAYGNYRIKTYTRRWYGWDERIEVYTPTHPHHPDYQPSI